MRINAYGRIIRVFIPHQMKDMNRNDMKRYEMKRVMKMNKINNFYDMLCVRQNIKNKNVMRNNRNVIYNELHRGNECECFVVTSYYILCTQLLTKRLQ